MSENESYGYVQGASISCGNVGTISSLGGLSITSTPQEPVRAKQIVINAQNYGYVVNIGCQTFAIEKAEDVVKGIQAYLIDPEATEKLWMKEKTLPFE